MRRRVAFLVVVAVLLAMIAFRCAAFIHANRDSPLSIPLGVLDLGEVWTTKDFQIKVPITNSTSRLINVRQIRTSCGCTQVDPSAFKLRPGASQEVTITANLAVFSSDQEVTKSQDAGSAFGIAIMPVFTVSDGPESTLAWNLTGRVHTALNLPHSVFFDRVDMNSETVKRSFVVTPLVEVEGLDLSSTSGTAIATDSASRRDLKAPMSVEVSLNRLEAPGWFDAPLTIAALLPGGKRLPAQEVRLLGTAVADIDWAPKQLVFGAVEAGNPLVGEIVVWSRSGTRFDLAATSDSNERADGLFDLDLHPAKDEDARIVATVRLDSLQHSDPVLRLVATGGRLREPIRINVPIQVRPINGLTDTQKSKLTDGGLSQAPVAK